MKTSILLLSSLFIITLISSCGSSGGSSSTTITDDTTANPKATFTEVLTIIENNCHECHNKPTAFGAPMSLTTHTEISFFAEKSIERIKLDSKSGSFMPKGGLKLSDADITTIETWISEDKLDN